MVIEKIVKNIRLKASTFLCKMSVQIYINGKFGRCLVDFKYRIYGGDSYWDIFRYATISSS